MVISVCPGDWQCNSDFGKCYCFLEGNTGWHEANEMCKELDPKATLTSIGSQQENDYISSMTCTVWIGGTDEVEEGIWRLVNLCKLET